MGIVSKIVDGIVWVICGNGENGNVNEYPVVDAPGQAQFKYYTDLP